MLRYKTETRPGLVALYDIRPGNGVGQFLQPGARTGHVNGYMMCGVNPTDRLPSMELTERLGLEHGTVKWHRK